MSSVQGLSSAQALGLRLVSKTMISEAVRVVVSAPLRTQKGLSSNPSNIFFLLEVLFLKDSFFFARGMETEIPLTRTWRDFSEGGSTSILVDCFSLLQTQEVRRYAPRTRHHRVGIPPRHTHKFILTHLRLRLDRLLGTNSTAG